MKKSILMASVAILTFGITAESWAETTCTWEGTKLIIGGSGDFYGCDSVYDDDDNEIDWETQQEKITEIVFGDDVTAIGDNAFENVPNLTSLNTNNITEIGAECFDDLQSLKSIVMPKVEYIGSCAFESAHNLVSIEIPDTLTHVESDGLTFNNSIELIIPDSIDMSDWDDDALPDCDRVGSREITFKCKGNQDVCRAKIEEFASRADYISGNKFIFDAGDHSECFRTSEDEENVSYYHTGTECAELPESGNITCASGYADYNGNCYAQLPFSKKRWTPAEANEWLHDGNDNFVVITFKK